VAARRWRARGRRPLAGLRFGMARQRASPPPRTLARFRLARWLARFASRLARWLAWLRLARWLARSPSSLGRCLARLLESLARRLVGSRVGVGSGVGRRMGSGVGLGMGMGSWGRTWRHPPVVGMGVGAGRGHRRAAAAQRDRTASCLHPTGTRQRVATAIPLVLPGAARLSPRRCGVLARLAAGSA
jgi:hypothetical protein